MLDPKRAMRMRGWRRIGTAVVRWPGPDPGRDHRVSLIGLLTLPGYKPSYNDRNFLPADFPANLGYAAADRHFSQARMNPELLLSKPITMCAIRPTCWSSTEIAKGIFHVPGIAAVQAITRPRRYADRTHVDSVPDQHAGHHPADESEVHGQVMADMLVQADEMQTTIATMQKMSALTGRWPRPLTPWSEDEGHDGRHRRIAGPHRRFRRFLPAAAQLLLLGTALLRHPDLLVDPVDLRHARRHRHADRRHSGPAARPGTPGQADAAVGHADAADDRDHEDHEAHHADDVSTQKGMQDQMAAMQDNSTAMGQAFDASKNDDSFYLPPEVFDNADFKRGLKMFVSPDGKSVRFIISHDGDPATPKASAHRRDQECGVRSHQGHAPGGFEDLSGRHRGDVQGHAARVRTTIC